MDIVDIPAVTLDIALAEFLAAVDQLSDGEPCNIEPLYPLARHEVYASSLSEFGGKIFSRLFDEILGLSIKNDLVYGLEGYRLIVDVDKLGKSVARRAAFALFLGQSFLYLLPMALCRRKAVVSVAHRKYDGVIGAANCVSWSFDKKGVIVIDNEDEELDEDEVMMEVLDCGADDFEPDGETFIVYTAPDDVAPVADKITAAGYKLLSAQVEMLPQNGYIKLTNEDDIKNMQKMLDMFEDNDDVQNVWHNWEE